VVSGTFAGFTQSQPVNGEKATVSGVEVSWQQHLTFLPGAFSGLGVLANYTYTRSRAKVPGRDDDPDLLRTTPKEFNFNLTYDRGPFSARAAVTYNDAYIWQYNFSPGADLGLHGPNGDVYLYPHTQCDAQASYRLLNGLQVIASVLNINNAVFGFYQGSPRYPIQREFYRRTFALGFRLLR
jgi:outer membrane receptor protein involved in Fe transport